MQVTLDGAQANLALGSHAGLAQIGLEQLRTGVHSAGSNQNLGDIHFVLSKLFANDAHTAQQALFQNLLCGDTLFQCLRNQGLDHLCLTLLQGLGNFNQNAHSFALLDSSNFIYSIILRI